MELLAHTRIVMWEGGSLWVVDATPPAGPGPRRTEPHAHHAIQIVLGLGASFRLQAGEATGAGPVVGVAADCVHVFEAEGLLALLFLEPESPAGRAIASRLFKGRALADAQAEGLEAIREGIAANFRAPARDDATLIALGRAATTELAGGVRAPEPDPRVRKMVAWASRQLEGPVSLADVGAVGGLSSERLRHLFVEQTGLPFRTYLLWLRLTRAVEIMAAGSDLTRAAHDAGFADSAHFSRTFKRMFGVAPTSLRMS